MASELNLNVEQLEQRRLMAVDVSMGGDVLRINGDNTGQLVDVTGTGVNGGVAVSVDGGARQTFSGVESIRVNLRGGDDYLGFSHLQVNGRVQIQLGNGADEFDMDTSSQGRVGDVFIGDDLRINLGNDDNDTIDWDSAHGHGLNFAEDVVIVGAETVSWVTTDNSGAGINIGDDVRIRAALVDLDANGGPGSNPEDIHVGDDLSISLVPIEVMQGDVVLDLDDVNVGGDVRLRGTSGNDAVEVGDGVFGGRFIVRLGADNDRFDFKGTTDESSFADGYLIIGGSGHDIVMRNPNNILEGGSRETRGIEEIFLNF